MADVEHTWEFNQDDYNKVLKASKYTKAGICEGLVVSWIAYHAETGGQASLKGKLTWGGDIDPTKIAVSCQRFGSTYTTPSVLNGTTFDKPGTMVAKSKDQLTAKGLDFITAIWGIAPTDTVTLKQGVGTMFGGINQKVTNKITKKTQTFYVPIRLNTTNAGHTVGMRFRPDGSGAFFDPNSGEYSFTEIVKFRDWFYDYLSGNRLWKKTNWMRSDLFLK